MDGEGHAPEDLSVSLRWPGDDQDVTRREPRQTPDPDTRATDVPNPGEQVAADDLKTDDPSAGEPRGLLRRRRSPSQSTAPAPPAARPAPPRRSPAADPAPTAPATPSTRRAARGPDASLADRLDDLADALASTTSRIDTLTDAVVTLRGFVNERMGDVGDAVANSQTQITSDLERALSRVQAQTPHQLAESLTEVRAQTTRELEESTTKAQAQMAQQLNAAIGRLEAQAARRTADDERRHEEVTEAVRAVMAAGEDNVRRLDSVATAISTEVATVGQTLADQVDALAATSDESRQESERVTAGITGLSETVADALAQVADRLEQLAANNHGQQDIVEAVAEALDDVAVRLDDLDTSNRSRHDRVVAAITEVASKRTQAEPVNLEPVTDSLERVETLVEALVDATEDATDTPEVVATVVGQLERLQATIADQLEAATTSAARTLTDAAEQAAGQIRTAAPPVAERSTLAAMTRIEDRMAELTRQREEQDDATKEMLDSLEETVGRLASAQAEDLERILDSVETAPAPRGPVTASLSAADAQRLTRIEEDLRRLSRQPKLGGLGSDVDDSALEQMASLGNQIEALRRRMAVRGRPQTPVFDAKTLDALAEAVAARLAPAGGSASATKGAPRKAPAKRASTPLKSTPPRKVTAPRRKQKP